MKKILVASSKKDILAVVTKTCEKYKMYFDADFCSDTDEIKKYINYELPEIKIIDFSSPEIDCNEILSLINDDPWLHYGGIIAVVTNKKEQKKLEDKKNGNILVVQTLDVFKTHFERLLRILWKNQQLLFNRGMQEAIGGGESGSFICENDPLDLQVYAKIMVSYLYSSNRIDSDTAYSLHTTLMELLLNALEHGNLEISYDEKTKWLERGSDMMALIYEKCKNSSIADRRIYIGYTIDNQKATFSIRDDGVGFDWKSHLEQDLMAGNHGMGVKMSESLVGELNYNLKGNEVSFCVQTIQNEANTVPGIMNRFEAITYNKKMIVCREGEPTNDLFFIVSGRYAVYAGNKLVSVLTPNDIFIGEMSFLLNDRRSATIMSADEGKLIKIPKGSFMALIRKNPHYGIFLSKLIAQRLVAQTKRTLELTKIIENIKKDADNS